MSENLLKWTGGLTIVAALWLVFSPLWINYTSTGNVWAQVIIGIIVGILALVKLSMPDMAWPSALNFLAGIWFVVAPWILTSTPAVKWNQVVLGLIVAALAAVELTTVDSTIEVATDSSSLSSRESSMSFGEQIPGPQNQTKRRKR